MPMLLRSRKSIHPRQVEEEVAEATATTTTTPGSLRRSTRPHGTTRFTYEDSDESDSESVQSQMMEIHQRPQAEEEQQQQMEEDEESAEEADVTKLKHCSIVLDRLEGDDKEDMNRKGGKPVSRIPTFHKRPAQNTELPVPKKDTPVHVAHLSEKAVSGSVEAAKSKPPEVREKAIPVPSVRVPKIGFEGPSAFIGTEHTAAASHRSLITSPKAWSLSESVQSPLMTVSPRPALRPEQGLQQNLPEQDESKTLEADTEQDAPISEHPRKDTIDQKPPEDSEEKYTALKRRDVLDAAGDMEKPEIHHTTEISQEKAIMDEEPPWEREPMNLLESKDSRSSSDVECEDDSADEKSKCHDSGDVKEHHEPLLIQSESLNLAEKRDEVAPEKPTKASSSQSTKRSGCSSFTLCFFLPITLLLLGGFGQHVWHYGLPRSVAQLAAQLELHMLEGFGLQEPCSTDCRVHLVESIPIGLYPSSPPPERSIADSWLHLLNKANSSVHIAAFYFTLREGDLDSSDSQGRLVFEQLKQLESKGVKLQIAVNAPQTSTQDTAELAATGAEVREVDLKAVTGGIVHTKMWVVDQKHFYLGSANMDWRSLSQVKEVGLSVEDCSCLAQDAYRIFGVYWSIGDTNNNGSLPPYWPARLSALSSSQNPLRLKFNGVPAQVYLSSAPPQISARGRSDDLSTILSVIEDAQEYIHISVMDYLPLSEFTEPLRFWPAIDSALRAAACTKSVQVRLLVSCWAHSPGAMFTFLQSLLVLNRPPLNCDIDVKVFKVPSTREQMKIPFARVNHAKFMVTDRVVYIGTSNWSENYFTQTAGVGLVVNQTGSEVKAGQQTLQSQAEELFHRDWSHQYATPLSVDDVEVCPRGRH
ncbi:Phospholipase D3 [Collichthys lucidus]|uniref:Phospholipase D3 n=1 Tax=Collichthys lucidus TaxID=240159 RepID=A0A4U5UF67_COLLU|nr:Phospholipase D3 [Collichthys lucidus]